MYAKNGRPFSPKVVKAQLKRVVELAGGEGSLGAYLSVHLTLAL